MDPRFARMTASRMTEDMSQHSLHKKSSANCSGNGDPQNMPDGKAQNSKSEAAQHIRKPVHAKVHAQKSPRERQQHHDPTILRHTIEHRTRHRQIVHRMSRRKAVLVERRNFGLDLRIRGKRARTLGAKLDTFVNHKAHRKRNKSLPKNRQKVLPACPPNQKCNEQSPNIAITEAHVKFEELRRLRGKMPIRPIHRNAVIKIFNFIKHQREFRIFRSPHCAKIPII